MGNRGTSGAETMGKLNGCTIKLMDDGKEERLVVDVQILGDPSGAACRTGAYLLSTLSRLNKDLFGMEIPYPDPVREMIALHIGEDDGSK